MRLNDERCQKIIELQKRRGSKVLLYVTGDRQGWETQIHQEVLSYLAGHLDIMSGDEKLPKLSLILYTRGGNTLAAWSIINLIRQYCDYLEVIVPSKAHSAGTLICLGSSKIVMTKQSTLSPIDPTIKTPLNPPVPFMQGETMPISVEAINGYKELVKSEFGITEDRALAEVVKILSEKIHPLVLGEVYRARAQIQMLARKLLRFHLPEGNDEAIDHIVDFLCKDSGSHDYTINLEDAKKMGLNVEEAKDEDREIINAIFANIAKDLQLNVPFNPKELLNGQESVDFLVKRAVIQSVQGGVISFVTDANMVLVNNDGVSNLQVNRNFEGWKNE